MEYPHVVWARLYGHIEPIERARRYDDPLQAALDEAGAGAITGGGTQLSRAGGIEFADLEIELADRGPSLNLVARTLEDAGAPRGSELVDGEEEVLREFGRQECLAIFLDGISLPDEVYDTLDFERVVEDIATAAGPDSYRGFWQRNEETGLFYYGASAEAMFGRVEPLLHALPIGQNARVVVGYGKEGLPSRTVRMPRR